MAPAHYAYVRQCPEFSQERINLRRHTTALKLFPPTAPLEAIEVDILGPLPASRSGDSHLLVITDRFAKLKRTIPLGRTKEFYVANAFSKNLTCVYGPTLSLLTDNGPYFNSKFYQEVYRQLVKIAYSPLPTIRAPTVRPSASTVQSQLPCNRTFQTIPFFWMCIPTPPRLRITRKCMRKPDYSPLSRF